MRRRTMKVRKSSFSRRRSDGGQDPEEGVHRPLSYGWAGTKFGVPNLAAFPKVQYFVKGINVSAYDHIDYVVSKFSRY